MRTKRQSIKSLNIKLLARGLEDVAIEGKSLPELEGKPTNEKPPVLHDSRSIEPNTKFSKRGPKKDALIDTSKLLTM
jgi:hypothetical protein